jgi:hypothetical protein
MHICDFSTDRESLIFSGLLAVCRGGTGLPVYSHLGRCRSRPIRIHDYGSNNCFVSYLAADAEPDG